MLVLLFFIENRVDDVFLISRHSCDQTGRQFNREIKTYMIFIFPSCNVTNNLFLVIVAKLLNDRSCSMPLQLHLSREIG